MGALPKNKITRVERGKRRQGNRPTLTKDTSTNAIPLHKRGMVAEFLQLLGVTSEKETVTSASKKAEAKSKTTAKPKVQATQKIAPAPAKSTITTRKRKSDKK